MMEDVLYVMEEAYHVAKEEADQLYEAEFVQMQDEKRRWRRQIKLMKWSYRRRNHRRKNVFFL